MQQFSSLYSARPLALDTHPDSPLIAGRHLAVIRANGPDAEKFLQGQLTADLAQAKDGIIPAMHLDTKGRGLFSYLVQYQDEQQLNLLTPAGRATDALQYLKKYAVFSKVTLTLEEDCWPLLAPASLALANSQRYLLGDLSLTLCTESTLRNLAEQHSIADYAQWIAQDSQLGFSHIWPETQGRFLPQELNYDLIQGISFKKGCYLGQEVVARMHFKGQLKQRLARLAMQSESPLQPGLILRNEQQQAVAEIAQVVANQAGWQVLAVLKHQHQGPLFLEQQTLAWEKLTVAYTIPA